MDFEKELKLLLGKYPHIESISYKKVIESTVSRELVTGQMPMAYSSTPTFGPKSPAIENTKTESEKTIEFLKNRSGIKTME